MEDKSFAIGVQKFLGQEYLLFIIIGKSTNGIYVRVLIRGEMFYEHTCTIGKIPIANTAFAQVQDLDHRVCERATSYVVDTQLLRSLVVL